MGLGFRQTNYVTTKNTYFYYITGVPDLSASVPEETIELINYKTDRRGKYESLILPIGLQYAAKLGKSPLHLGIATGADFQFKVYDNLESLNVRTFGISWWIQPTIAVDIRAFKLFIFGRMNAPLTQQLHLSSNKLRVQRNQLYGGGIGLMYQLNALKKP